MSDSIVRESLKLSNKICQNISRNPKDIFERIYIQEIPKTEKENLSNSEIKFVRIFQEIHFTFLREYIFSRNPEKRFVRIFQEFQKTFLREYIFSRNPEN
jgi:hypothetical protein